MFRFLSRCWSIALNIHIDHNIVKSFRPLVKETHRQPSTQRNVSMYLRLAESWGKYWHKRWESAERAKEEPVMATSTILMISLFELDRSGEQQEDGGPRNVTHHEGDFLASLRLPADHYDASAEDKETHGQQCQDPHFCTKDWTDAVRGEIAEHTHRQHCGLRKHH